MKQNSAEDDTLSDIYEHYSENNYDTISKNTNTNNKCEKETKSNIEPTEYISNESVKDLLLNDKKEKKRSKFKEENNKFYILESDGIKEVTSEEFSTSMGKSIKIDFKDADTVYQKEIEENAASEVTCSEYIYKIFCCK